MTHRVSRRTFLASAAASMVPTVVSYGQPKGLGLLPASADQTKTSAKPDAAWQDAGVIDVSRSPFAKLKSVPVSAVMIQDGFWSRRRNTNLAASIPSMHDELLGHGRIDNFLRLKRNVQATAEGPVFADSDIYKWTEAVGFALQTSDQLQLRKTTDSAAFLLYPAPSLRATLSARCTRAAAQPTTTSRPATQPTGRL